MKESRIDLNDNFAQTITKMCEGNPGALNVLISIMKKYENDFNKIFPVLCVIDTMHLYGSHLYMLWNDCCDRDLNKTLKVIDYYCQGKINDNDINERIKSVGRGKSFDDLLRSDE